jgi:signal transduction histidine kinase/ligand-binding sensor domain-containing protein/DNA-binding response OmpR family regulator
MRKFLWVIAVFLTSVAYGNETLPTIEHITSNQGLSNNTVRSMLQDKTGFIWFATLNGLNRYDGIRIKTIIPEIPNPNSLTSGKIKELYEDSHGHIWVRTYSDIFHCYNPRTESFMPLFNKSEDFYIKHNSFYEDKAGNVWLGSTDNGCVRYTFENNQVQIRQFNANDEASRLPSNMVNDIFQDSRKNTWILTAGGLCRVASGNKTESMLKDRRNLSFIKAYEQNNKVFFIAETGIVFVYNLQKQQFERELKSVTGRIQRTTALGKDLILLSNPEKGIQLLNTKTEQFSSGDVLTGDKIRGNIYFANDELGGVWVYNFSGRAWRINTNSVVKRLQLIPASVLLLIDEERYQFKADQYGNIWISTYGNGLFRYNIENDELKHFNDNRFLEEMGTNYLLSILADCNDNIWIGTENMGVNKISISSRHVQQILTDPDNKSINSNNVRSMLEDRNGNIWVGTKAGNLYKYDSKLENRTIVLEKNYKVYSIYEDSDGTIWLGTRGNGILGLPGGQTKNMINYRQTDRNGSLSDNNVFSMIKDRKGRIWAATFGGGISVKTNPEGTEGFRTFFDDDEWTSFTRHIMTDSNGDIWAATSYGVNRFNPDSLLNNRKAYRYYTFDSQSETSLSTPEVRYIFEDSDKNIWMATSGGGLNLFTGETESGNGKFRVFKNRQGIVNDNIMCILEDNSKNLWVSTENGMQKFNPFTGIFQFYRFSNDFSANIFSETTGIKCRDGRMMWGSLNGFFVFDPANLVSQNKASNKVIFTGFSIFNTDATIGPKNAPLKESATFAGKVTLKHSDQVFNIEFSTLNFKDPKANQFMFILENYEKRWNTTTDGFHMATYRNVPPGNYVFKVKSINSDGVWDENESSLEIVIKPPYWRSTIAYLIYFIIAIVLIYIGVRIALNFYRLDNAVRVERQLTDYKLRFFTNISHEFRTPLTLIKGSIDSLTEVKDRLPGALQKLVDDIDKNTSHMMRLIEQLLEFRKLQNNKQKLNLQRVEAVSFLKDIFNSFENVAAKTNIDYQFICSETSVPVFFDKNKVDKIIFNLISNAFKFTPRGGKITLSVEIEEESHMLVISVTDNGIGIPKEKQELLFSRFMQINFSQQGTGIGLHLVSEFANLHQGKVDYRENETGGSIFAVSFSLDSSIYSPDDFVTEQITVENDDKKEVYHFSDFITDQKSDLLIDLVPIYPVAGKKYKVLVIDDNDDIRDFLEEKLSPYFEVICATDGDTGIRRSMEDDPDLIICDVMMPGLNGFELTRKLKDDFETCHIPVVLLTAYLSDEHENEGVEAGADAYITKPFSLKHLMLQINKLLEKREMLHKHYALNAGSSNAIQMLDADSSPEDDDKPLLPEKDHHFLLQVEEILDKHLTDAEFTVDDFARMLNTGRTLFFKKIKSLTGYSPNEFIRMRRMQKAAELLKTYKYNVSEVSYMVGINDPFYFSKCFKAQFGCSPSKFLNS